MSKPRLLINTKNMVLIDYLPGKTYITDLQHPKTQAKQKGPTCWFYSYERARFGKKVEELKPFADQTNEPTAVELLNLRRLEKLISEHRKSQTKLFSYYEMLLTSKKLDVKVVIRKNAKKHLKILKAELGKNSNSEEINSLISELEKFKNRKVGDELFSRYLHRNYIKENTELYVHILEKLGMNSEQTIRQQISKCCLSPEKINYDYVLSYQLKDDIEFRYTIYQHAAMEAIDHAFGLKDSSFNPSEGIDSLLKCLAHENVLIASGVLGKLSYDKDPENIGNLFGTYEVYCWEPGHFKFEEQVKQKRGHRIRVIGAEKSGDDGFIYFIDPLDESNPNELRKVYKIPFKEFIIGLDYWKGHRLISYTEPGLTEKYAEKYNYSLKLFNQNKLQQSQVYTINNDTLARKTI